MQCGRREGRLYSGISSTIYLSEASEQSRGWTSLFNDAVPHVQTRPRTMEIKKSVARLPFEEL
jgi:hypothetical protein